jgi:hypothetical protein
LGAAEMVGMSMRDEHIFHLRGIEADHVSSICRCLG